MLAFAVGTIGGIYGIGGGSILGPILVGLGFSVFEVAPAALAATFLASFAGVATYALLSSGRAETLRPIGRLASGWESAGLPAPTSARAFRRACRRCF